MRQNLMNLPVMLLLLLLTSYGCNRTAEPSNEAQNLSEHDDAPADQVTLTPVQLQTVGIALGSFDTLAIKDLIKANGVLDLPPQNRATVTNLLGGLITKINVIQGEKVKKGQVLAYIENPEVLRLQQTYLEARNHHELLKKEYLRQKELFEEKIVAGKRFQAAEAEYESSKTQIISLENQLQQIGISPQNVAAAKITRQIPVTAPISGFVHRIDVFTGAFAEPARPIFEIVDNHHIHVDLQVYEKDIPKVKEGQNVFFTLRGDTTMRYTAEIFSVGKAFERDTRSVGVHAEIKNGKESDLLPGMYVEGRIQVGSSAKVPVLPEDAVVNEGDLAYIFIKIDDVDHCNGEEKHGAHLDHKKTEHLTFKKVPVSTGVVDMGYIEVKPHQEIPRRSAIVVKGAYYLQAQMTKGADGDGHAH